MPVLSQLVLSIADVTLYGYKVCPRLEIMISSPLRSRYDWRQVITEKKWNRWITNANESPVGGGGGGDVATERALSVSGICLINALSRSAW